MKVTKVAERLGIDIGKNVFYLFGVDAQGTPVLRKKLRWRPAVAPITGRGRLEHWGMRCG